MRKRTGKSPTTGVSFGEMKFGRHVVRIPILFRGREVGSLMACVACGQTSPTSTTLERWHAEWRAAEYAHAHVCGATLRAAKAQARTRIKEISDNDAT